MSRIAEIERLRSRMRQHHFVAISGPRNCGKSTICRQLKQSLESEVKNMREIKRRYKAKAGMKWKVAYIRLNREDNPFDLLTRAIAGPASNILVGPGEKVDPLFESSIKAALLDQSGNGLLRIYQQFLQFKQYNFLVIIDQFENLFFTTILSQEEKHRFVRLLLNASYDRRQLYVTVAIRPPKADLWKQNFRNLSDAVTECQFRLYNPNQIELEHAIIEAFMQEKERLLSNVGDEDLLSPDWLMRQEIYQSVAMKRVREIANVLHDVLRKKWKSMRKDGGGGNTRMVPPEQVKIITKQLRGTVDRIWPQLLLQSNVGALAPDEREDLVEDLKSQLTDVLTAELLKKLARLLAEELYFEREPLVQIEKSVRQLMRDWSDVLVEIRGHKGRRKKKIVTVTLQEQNANRIGAASGDLSFERSGPIDIRAEKAYEALATALDKRIARKALTVLGRTANIPGAEMSLTVDSLAHAIGRFSSRIIEVLTVFHHVGVLNAEPEGDLKFSTHVGMSDPEIVDKWTRLNEWVNGPGAGGPTMQDDGTGSRERAAAHSQPAIAPEEVSMDLVEDFGDAPDNSEEYVARAEKIYTTMAPPIRKRVAQRLFVALHNMSPDNSPVNQNELIKGIGRFEDHLREITEYFIRQGILKPEGGLHWADPNIPKNWERFQTWKKK